MTLRAVVLLAAGNEEIEALTPVDILRRAGIAVTLAGLGGRSIVSSHQVTVTADTTLEELAGDFDAVIVPGGMPGTVNLCESPAVTALVQKQFAAGRLVAAICAGPMVLDRAGILKDHSFTCFPGVEKKIGSGNWTIAPVVVDRTIITSRAMGTALPFSLAIVEYLLGKDEADRLAGLIVYEGGA